MGMPGMGIERVVGGTSPRGSLTAYEVHTRNAPSIRYGFADGHAAQYDDPHVRELIHLLPQFDEEAAAISDREAETVFYEIFMQLFAQHGALGRRHYKILPNASLSIDLVYWLCARRSWTADVIDPVFDNLALYAKERGVPIRPISEHRLRRDGADALELRGTDVVVLVCPNNPTGFIPSADTLREIAERCARNRVTLVIDASFRAYDTTRTDHYSVLDEAGCSFAVIEDTGKTFPTRERKASILSYSPDLARDISELYQIHMLGWSTPILLMLAHLARGFVRVGLDAALLDRVRSTRRLAREAVAGTILRPARCSENSTLPVEWLEVLDDRFDDQHVVAHLERYGIGLLPGRHFFFESGAPRPTNFVRLSLLKERHLIEEGLQKLRRAVLEIR